jgi:hypothetical protein
MRAAHGKRFIREQIRQETPPAEGERLESGSDSGTVEGVTEIQEGGGSQNSPSRGSGCPQLHHNELRPGKDQQGHELCAHCRDAQMQRHPPQVVKNAKTPAAKGRTDCTPPKNSTRRDDTAALQRTHSVVEGTLPHQQWMYGLRTPTCSAGYKRSHFDQHTRLISSEEVPWRRFSFALQKITQI